MDQTYGPTAPGDPLQWIDNASIGGTTDSAGGKFPARPEPWAADPGWTIAASIDGQMNGKFVVYQDEG